MSGFSTCPFSQSIFVIPIDDEYDYEKPGKSHNSFAETSGSFSSISNSEPPSEVIFVEDIFKSNWNAKVQQSLMHSKYKFIKKLMKF